MRLATALAAMASISAGPPGVPRIGDEPATTPPAPSEIKEAVLILDRAELADESIIQRLRDRRPGHLVILDDWIVVADSSATIDACRNDLSEHLARSASSWSIDGRVIQLDADSPATPAAIEEIRRDPAGATATELFNGTHPAIETTLAAPRLTVREGRSAEARIGGDDGPSIRWSITLTANDDADDVSLLTDLEVARDRTIGRRLDRHGSRAIQRRRPATVGRPVAVTTAPFADTTVRELDGGRRTLPRSPETDEPPIVLVMTARPSETPAPASPALYRTGEATRDGTGVFHLGREIAQVMGHLGAGWLERPEREREERTTLLLSMLGLRPGMIVADIGAGSGYFTRRLASLVGPTGRVIATDIQPEMLEILARGLETENIENVEMVLGRVDDSGLGDERVDLILLVDVYHEFDHPWEMARSMRRALRPGGRVALVEYRANDPAVPIKPLHTMTAEQSRMEFEAAGFRLVETREDGLPWQRLQLFERVETAAP